jgi:hypothetical protein
MHLALSLEPRRCNETLEVRPRIREDAFSVARNFRGADGGGGERRSAAQANQGDGAGWAGRSEPAWRCRAGCTLV